MELRLHYVCILMHCDIFASGLFFTETTKRFQLNLFNVAITTTLPTVSWKVGNANICILKSFPWARGCCVHVFLVYIYTYLRYIVLFCDGVRRLGTGNTEESNNKSTESSRTETESNVMRKRSKYFKVWVNETWADGDPVAKQERNLQEPVWRK